MKSLARKLTPDPNRSLRSRRAGCNSRFSCEPLARPLTGRRLQRWTVHSRPNHSLGSRFVYDKNGRVISKTQTTTGATNPSRTNTYSYNAEGQLLSMITPSGQSIGYVYSFSNNNGFGTSGYLGRVSAITLNGAYIIGFTQYQAFGPASGWAWGNHGLAAPGGTYPNNLHLRVFDLDYRPTAIASDPEGYNRDIKWDQANRITAITVPGTNNGASTHKWGQTR